MSLQADPHVVQLKILRELLMNPGLGFAELMKSSQMSSDHFTFHIKKLIKLGMITKHSTGEYILTTQGKEFANRMDTEGLVLERQPKVSVVLMVSDGNGRYLQQQRLKHPYYGYWGRPTGKVRWGETLVEAGSRELLEETGLTAQLAVKGVYHKLDYDKEHGELLEDKYLYIIYGTDPQGELIVDMPEHHNEWLSEEEFMYKEKRFGNVNETTEIVNTDGFFYREKKFRYQADDY